MFGSYSSNFMAVLRVLGCIDSNTMFLIGENIKSDLAHGSFLYKRTDSYWMSLLNFEAS